MAYLLITLVLRPQLRHSTRTFRCARSGSPRPESLTTQLWFPDGYRMPPHFHPFDEHVQVLQGTFLVGMGDKFNLLHACCNEPGA